MSRSRHLFVCALLLLVSALVSRDASAQATARARSTPVTLRAGTAAAPFGPATVISDFDADGAPDVAVADRPIRNGAHYRIEVHLSGGSTQTVSFLSTKGALRIAALDLDNDRDQDLIVTPVLSREVVGIWLNDGAGHFTRRRDAPYGSTVPVAQAVPTISGSSLAFLPGIPGRRFHSVDLTRATSVSAFDDNPLPLRGTEPPSPTEGFFSSVPARAPPSSTC